MSRPEKKWPRPLKSPPRLDAEGELVCGRCYLADPPLEDIEGIFAEVMAHMCEGA